MTRFPDGLMAWLAMDDLVVAAELPPGWRTLLATYVVRRDAGP